MWVTNKVSAVEWIDYRYLVKWVDLSYKDCTWEDPDTIPDEVIKKYNARQTIAPWKLQPPRTKAERVAKGEKSILHFKDNKVCSIHSVYL